MASNFNISLRKNNSNLQIKLSGDFDGTSAFELINALKEHDDDCAKIYINTDGLFHIYPFGVDVFQKNGAINKLHHDVIITGEHATEITPLYN